MIVSGIIAEYNPFHNGHQHHIEQSRRETGADYVIVVLSSNFTQRGEPAVIDKFTRAKMALKCGADLVLELPVSHSAASAEFFAQGGVSILDQLGVVDYLCFGSECGDASLLRRFAEILLEEPMLYAENLKSGLSAGHSYPAARSRALIDYAPELAMHEEVLSSPNNILGIEYVKALLKRNSSIRAFTMLRAGAGYHDRLFATQYCSALAIREALLSCGGNFDASSCAMTSLASQMPAEAFQILTESLKSTPPITAGDLSEMLIYKLRTEQEQGYAQYADVSEELSDRIKKHLGQFQSYTQFCDLLKAKNMTYARISRSLLHILLNEKKEGAAAPGNAESCAWARVLGFRRDAAPLLTEIKKHASIPLITKLAAAGEVLSPDAHACLLENLRRESIYESIVAMKTGRPARDEREIPIAIL